MMKGDESDFEIKPGIRTFKVKGMDFVFEYEPLTTAEKIELLPYYTRFENGVESNTSIVKYGLCLATKIKQVPWSEEVISKISGMDKSWERMGFQERIRLLKSLKEDVLSAIIEAILKEEGKLQKELEGKKKA